MSRKRTSACEHFANGSKGATNLAHSMVKLIDTKPGKLKFVYEDAHLGAAKRYKIE